MSTYWNPENGEPVKFGKDETPPENFLPCHPDDPELKAKVRAANRGAESPAEPESEDLAGDMNKAQIIDALEKGGVEYDKSANKPVLVETLRQALKSALSERGVAYQENETAEALLVKVQGGSGAQE